jgi:GNAT superfamily N-acetyltransferase
MVTLPKTILAGLRGHTVTNSNITECAHAVNAQQPGRLLRASASLRSSGGHRLGLPTRLPQVVLNMASRTDPILRSADAAEVDDLARLWHAVWHQTHAPLSPPELVRLRTQASFRARLQAALADTQVAGRPGAVVGFCVLRGDELYQLFVATVAQGSRVGAALLADAETRLAARGVETAWLACAIGNTRAARFYEKRGWQLAGAVVLPMETSRGPFPVELWRYEKRLNHST